MVEYRKIDADTFTKLEKLRDAHKKCEQAYIDGIKEFHDSKIDRQTLNALFVEERQAHKAADEFFQKNFGIQTL